MKKKTRARALSAEELAWAAEDALAAETARVAQKYSALVLELLQLEERTGLYLTDANVDAENARDGGAVYETLEWWEMCWSSATFAAGSRAEEAGLDINKLVGRIIY